MINTITPEFIRHKVMDCGQAILYRYIDEQHKQPLALLKDVIIDEGGKIQLDLFSAYTEIYGGNIFPVELFFYKKGKAFFITAKGSAEKETASNDKNSLFHLHVEIDEMEYHPLGIGKKKLLFGFFG